PLRRIAGVVQARQLSVDRRETVVVRLGAILRAPGARSVALGPRRLEAVTAGVDAGPELRGLAADALQGERARCLGHARQQHAAGQRQCERQGNTSDHCVVLLRSSWNVATIS